MMTPAHDGPRDRAAIVARSLTALVIKHIIEDWTELGHIDGLLAGVADVLRDEFQDAQRQTLHDTMEDQT